MSTNVGNLNATLTLSQFEFNNGLRSSETAAMEFASTIETQSRRADSALNRVGRSSSMGNKIAMPLQQIGFGIQDFTSQLETRGLSGAIGAVTNNVQQLGAAFGPVGMAATALGGALAGVLLPRLLETGSVFGKTAEEMSRFESKVKGLSEKTFAPWRELENTKFDLMKGTEKQLDDRLASMRHKGQLLFQEAKAEQRAALNADQRTQQGRDEATVRSKRIEELNAQVRDLDKGIAEIEKLRPQLRAREKFNSDFDANATRQKEMFKAESDLRRKGLEDYGSQAERMESKIASERARLAMLGIGKEAAARFEAQSRVDLMRSKIADDERKIAEMGSPAGMSAGALRNSASGISVVNRAAAGTTSEQSLAKEALRTSKDQLKELEKVVRALQKPPTIVQL